jgi:RNA polymerase sigma factor (sigma-70 family)
VKPHDPTPPADAAPDVNDWLRRMALNNDKAAFIALFHHFAPRVKAYLRRQGLDSANADDLTQDVMLQVWSRAAQFDPAKARASTWIYTIARNRLIDVWRKQKNSPVEFHDPSALPEDVPAETPLAQQVVETGQDSDQLHAALAHLPEAQRDMIEESFFKDRSHHMIARARKIPLGTVKSRLRLALERLRLQLKKEEP